MLNKQSSKQNLTKNNGFLHVSGIGGGVAAGSVENTGSTSGIGSEDHYGTSTAASKPQINFNRESSSNFGGDNSFRETSGIGGSIKQASTKLKEPILLNQPSVDEFAQFESK